MIYNASARAIAFDIELKALLNKYNFTLEAKDCRDEDVIPYVEDDFTGDQYYIFGLDRHNKEIRESGKQDYSPRKR